MTIKVLVVDDEPIVRLTLRRGFSRHDDLEVVGEGDNGEAAVALALRLRPDVIVMDLHMPRLSGLGAVRHLRMLGLEVPVVFLTADTEASIDVTGLDPVRVLLKADVGMSETVTAVREAAGNGLSPAH